MYVAITLPPCRTADVATRSVYRLRVSVVTTAVVGPQVHREYDLTRRIILRWENVGLYQIFTKWQTFARQSRM
jgi:hypothetical protein